MIIKTKARKTYLVKEVGGRGRGGSGVMHGIYLMETTIHRKESEGIRNILKLYY